MSTLLEYMAGNVPRGKERGKSRVRSTSRGPVVVLKGWRRGMNKVRVTMLLRESGVPLSVAYDATNRILRGEAASVRLREGSDVATIRGELESLGVVL